MERFVKEYANYKIKDIKGNQLMMKSIQNEKIEKINKILKIRERGLITINETIKMILEI